VNRLKAKAKTEFGDFQTPYKLATAVCKVLASRTLQPATLLEPTCGTGSFLVAAVRQFPHAQRVIGCEINPAYLDQAKRRTEEMCPPPSIEWHRRDALRYDWQAALDAMPEPVLILGNPPWVTSAGLGSLDSANQPAKSNFQNHRGLDALTGKSNFDIAEWLVIRFLESIGHRRAAVAMLLKTQVARRVMVHAWKSKIALSDATLLTFNAQRHFSVAADACLLICEMGSGPAVHECTVGDLDHPDLAKQVLSYESGVLIADRTAHERWHHLHQKPATEPAYRWRSGVKHDCAIVMELHREGTDLRNGLEEIVDVESEYVFPLVKGSEVARGNIAHATRALVITQKETGQDTAVLAHLAPRTWQYLCRHGKALESRKSSIYRNRPRFSIFGVGAYTFAPWKVAICGLYKKIRFTVVGSDEGRPIVLDDTCYHVACKTQQEAELLASLLNSKVAAEFFSAFLFWDSKRPFTAELLGRLDIPALATELGKEQEWLTLRPDLAPYAALEKSLF
jgi:hypothetical protein